MASQSQFNLLLNPEGGNVGIGTDEPGAKLEVKGNLVNNACINIKSQTSTNQSYELTTEMTLDIILCI